jgi:hypothetical protein
LRGCLTEKIAGPKKSLIKIGQPSHTSTRFFATRFFQMPARGRGGKSEGGKKRHAFPRRSFFRMPSADVVGNRRGQKTPRIVRYQAICPLRCRHGQDRPALGRRRPHDRLMELRSPLPPSSSSRVSPVGAERDRVPVYSPCFRLLLEMAVPWCPNLDFRLGPIPSLRGPAAVRCSGQGQARGVVP